jgi:aldose 1-epimerase
LVIHPTPAHFGRQTILSAGSGRHRILTRREGNTMSLIPNHDRLGTLDGRGAGDHDKPFQFGRRPSTQLPCPFTTHQFARLLLLRSCLHDGLVSGDAILRRQVNLPADLSDDVNRQEESSMRPAYATPTNLLGVPPLSGQQVEISSGLQRATIVEVGGGLRTYELGNWHVLDGYTAEQVCDGGRGQPLLPWPNRIADGTYVFEGREHQLPIDELPLRNAIHGLTRWSNWSARDITSNAVTMELTVHPMPGYPFALHLRLTYSLTSDGLSVRTTATNVGVGVLPFGAGFHPYFSVGTAIVDHAELRVPSRRTLEMNDQQVPTGELTDVQDTSLDFRRVRRIGSLVLDACYQGLERDADGLGTVDVLGPDGRSVSIWMDRAFDWLMVFTGDTLAPERRRQGLAIEPMTCPPNAFQTGDGVLTLAPGESFESRWGVRPVTPHLSAST